MLVDLGRNDVGKVTDGQPDSAVASRTHHSGGACHNLSTFFAFASKAHDSPLDCIQHQC